MIACNEWVAVYDVTTGSWQGELQVLLAAGFESQVQKLASALEDDQHHQSDESEQAPKQKEQPEEPQPQKNPYELVQLKVTVEEGRNLPTIKNGTAGKSCPNTYVTLPPTYNDSRMVDGHRPRSAPQTSKVEWNSVVSFTSLK